MAFVATGTKAPASPKLPEAGAPVEPLYAGRLFKFRKLTPGGLPILSAFLPEFKPF